MKTYKFEIADWKAAGAVDLARSSFQAQAAALGQEVTQIDNDTFDAMASSVDDMLTSLNVPVDAVVYVLANADVRAEGLVVNLSFNITYPVT